MTSKETSDLIGRLLQGSSPKWRPSGPHGFVTRTRGGYLRRLQALSMGRVQLTTWTEDGPTHETFNNAQEAAQKATQ